MSGIKLAGTGSALPAREVTNFDLEKMVAPVTSGSHPHRHFQPPLLLGGGKPTWACAWRRPARPWRAPGGPRQIGVCLVASLTQDTLTPPPPA